MKLRFDTGLAKTVGLEGSILIDFIHEKAEKSMGQGRYLKNELTSLVREFSDAPGAEPILKSLQDAGFLLFSLNGAHVEVRLNYAKLSGYGYQEVREPSLPVERATLSSGSTGFARHFNMEDNLIEGKIKAVLAKGAYFIQEGISKGVSPDKIESVFERFISYVRADPQRFYNKDLHNYWLFWVGNEVERQDERIRAASSRPTNHQKEQASLNAVDAFLGGGS
mgnify:CR=1 FL=1